MSDNLCVIQELFLNSLSPAIFPYMFRLLPFNGMNLYEYFRILIFMYYKEKGYVYFKKKP